jgi:hypothetical protein
MKQAQEEGTESAPGGLHLDRIRHHCAAPPVQERFGWQLAP